jgi:hypothetical protein
MRVFVNERPVEVAPGSDALAAVGTLDPGLARRVRESTAYLTDARGIRLPETTPLAPGSILRVVPSGRARGDPDADA